MTLARFIASVDGWNRVHGADDGPDPPSFEDHLKMRERYANV